MLPSHGPDFEAKVRFLTEEEGGRRTSPIVGYRPEFKYLDDDRNSYMIWPLQCFTEEGEIPEGQAIPRECYARFWIINAQLRKDIHQKRIYTGLRFLIQEGPRVVGHGEVTRILGLMDEVS